jgi:hypothetical protein
MTQHDDEGPGGADQGGGHGDEDHAAAADELGPVDWGAWGAGLLGVVAGLLIVLCFVLATAVS